ncbi:hypothetical protein FB565_004563 [Actinoplanes lutulentus]|nr:hypothetical protein [Actinoplanes lutulentus]MBB2944830.1 hypothetical protein [Actinoplanes lutulentus]
MSGEPPSGTDEDLLAVRVKRSTFQPVMIHPPSSTPAVGLLATF